jgi:hypothetical protein
VWLFFLLLLSCFPLAIVLLSSCSGEKNPTFQHSSCNFLATGISNTHKPRTTNKEGKILPGPGYSSGKNQPGNSRNNLQDVRFLKKPSAQTAVQNNIVNIASPMNTAAYNPFKNFDFTFNHCLLSGHEPVQLYNVIPSWLFDTAGLSGQEQIKLLDESIRTYESLKVPYNPEVYDAFVGPLDQKIAAAFSGGYEEVSKLDELDLFKWIGKFMYGLIYIEMNGAIKLKQLSGDGLNMSQGLMHKFGNLQTMIQSISTQVEFEDFKPWSIQIVKLENPETAFSFRDEINTLTFSLKIKDFGIIACLQDNGTNEKYHGELLEQIKGQALSEQQFEELCARFFYSAYLFNRLPEYAIMPVEGTIYIEAMPLRGTLNKSLFDYWQHKTYAQVLENFWKPWGHTLFEIIKDPTNPISYFNPPALPVVG